VSDDANAKTIAALLRERATLVGRGMDDRVAQVDAQLKLRGYEPPKTAEAPKLPEDPKRQAPQGRSAKPSTEQKGA
jgi:hypothetical protein